MSSMAISTTPRRFEISELSVAHGSTVDGVTATEPATSWAMTEAVDEVGEGRQGTAHEGLDELRVCAILENSPSQAQNGHIEAIVHERRAGISTHVFVTSAMTWASVRMLKPVPVPKIVSNSMPWLCRIPPRRAMTSGRDSQAVRADLKTRAVQGLRRRAPAVGRDQGTALGRGSRRRPS